ncbi:NADH-quinone oxidoreductase subunit K [Candidatus Bathyarchaeota archaeon]|nr:NADH-quinone oxidoreductase subunit K [Candidatus Bathyarchaeota archaeon]MBS7612826.1 NADH-quinone oxidoreductase subunit K [Candidatus Bathyarchaeota archaeon]MBS7617160.1 NADH-quinone oxidoreductase subunit K [Candidatus Bathyarchaeota archaeon]
MQDLAQLQTIYTATVIVLAAIGLYCIITKRELLKIVIGIEILTSAVNLNIMVMGLSDSGVDALAQSMTVFSMTIGACVAAVALALVVDVFRHYRTTDVRKLRRLKW